VFQKEKGRARSSTIIGGQEGTTPRQQASRKGSGLEEKTLEKKIGGSQKAIQRHRRTSIEEVPSQARQRTVQKESYHEKQNTTIHFLKGRTP